MVLILPARIGRLTPPYEQVMPMLEEQLDVERQLPPRCGSPLARDRIVV
jgi:hypothetical protein